MPPRSGEELKGELESRQDSRLVRALEMVAPGTALREGIDNILHARTGGLIVIGDADELAFLFSGGIKLDLDYSPALLYELAKMDGAIVLSSNATKIAHVNVQLTPDPTILTFETGTRHRTAERGSKQTDALVVAVAGLMRTRADGTTVGVSADKAALVHDYLMEDTDETFSAAFDQLVRLPNQDLLDFGRLAELLGYDRKLNTLDYPTSPRGFRILGRIPRLPKLVVQRIVSEFGGLEELLAATDGELETVDGVGEIRAKDIREGLRRQQEINLVDRYLQT